MIPFQWDTPSEWGPSVTDERNRGVISAVVNLPWAITASPVFQAASSRPYQCAAGSDWTGSGGAASGAAAIIRCWVDSSGKPVAANTAGASPATMNFLRGTPTWNLDTRVTKIIKIGERLKVNVFAEFYNITNKANFGNNYINNFSSAAFRQPAGYLNNGFSLPTSRQLQLGARFIF